MQCEAGGTDDDLTSILSTGFDMKEQQFRKPHVIRTIKKPILQVVQGGNKMATVGGYDAILTEGEAENGHQILSDDIDGYSELKTKKFSR
ncbi:MAG: hypothetical protein Ct9H300mP4_17990 [Gammaproteobacteria bacterium]|nr:MAG: hypothetical protein Ct9H300mP4_17990 [Gammaproteobacteria bacterium]